MSSQSELPPLVRLWILRLLMTLSVHKKFIGERGFNDDTLAEALALGSWIDSEARAFDPNAVRAELRKQHQAAERQAARCTAAPCLHNNIRRLKELVGLSEIDCRILEFAVLIHTERVLDDLADELGSLSTVKMLHVFVGNWRAGNPRGLEFPRDSRAGRIGIRRSQLDRDAAG